MPSVRIIYDTEGWALHNRALALLKYAPSDFEVSIARLGRGDNAATAPGDKPVDLVFVLPELEVAAVREVLRQRRWGTKIVSSNNSGWPRRISLFHNLYRNSDALIINNRDYWEKTGRLPGTYMIPNGVDLQIFKVKVPLERRKPKVLWTGSEFHRELKGYDEFIVPLQKELRAIGIDCHFLLVNSFGDNKLTPDQMADWYNTGTSWFVRANQRVRRIPP